MTREKKQYILDNIIPPARGCSGITIRGSNGSFFQESHELPHGVRNHKLSVTFNQDIQFRVLAGLWFLASCVEATFRRDRSAGGFENFGHVGTVGNSPSCFLCYFVLA